MATCTITFSDDNGSVLVDYTFGKDVDKNSLAHGMAITLLKSVLDSAKSYQTIEDTAPEVEVEPSRIITGDDSNASGH